MKKLLMLFALVCSGSALAQSPSATEQYRYGMHLDVAQVISISEPQDKCHPSPVTMIYRDSHGNVKSLKYLVAGTDCGNAND